MQKKGSFLRVFYLSPSKPKRFLLLFTSYSCVLKPSLLLLGCIKRHWVHFGPPKWYATFLLFLVWPPPTKPIIWLNLTLGSVPASIPPKSSSVAQPPPQQLPETLSLKHHQHGQFTLCCGWVSQNSPEQVSSSGILMSCQGVAGVSPSSGSDEAELLGRPPIWVPAHRSWWCWVMSIGCCAVQGQPGFAGL